MNRDKKFYYYISTGKWQNFAEKLRWQISCHTQLVWERERERETKWNVTVVIILIKAVGDDQVHGAVGGSTVLDPDSDPNSDPDSDPDSAASKTLQEVTGGRVERWGRTNLQERGVKLVTSIHGMWMCTDGEEEEERGGGGKGSSVHHGKSPGSLGL